MFQISAAPSGRGRGVAAPRRVQPWHRERRLALRIVVMAAVLGMLMTQVVLGSPGTRGSWVTVRQGQSLWSLAVARYTQMDPRQAIMNIQAANHLAGDFIYPGERLLLPSV